MNMSHDWVARFLSRLRRWLPLAVKDRLRGLYAWAPSTWSRSALYRQTLRELHRSEQWDRPQIDRVQGERLQQLMAHAGAQCPGYQQKWQASGVSAAEIREPRDLEKLPFLTKDDLRRSADLFRAKNVRLDDVEKVISGGTTGEPTAFYHARGHFDDVMSACKQVSWERAAYRWRQSPAIDLTAMFSGAPIANVSTQNVLYISISALDPTRFSEYVDAVRVQQAEFLIGFPSTVTLFARLIQEAHVKLPIKAIILASETLYDDQRALLDHVFDARIFQWYGLSENAGFAAACENSPRYHVFPTMGLVELVGDDGRPVRNEGEEGEIVLTGLTTWATPFIRYRTGDRGVWGPSPCPDCRRPFATLERISGRLQEYLMAADGRIVPHSALNFHDDFLDGAWQYQYFQDTPGRVQLRLVYPQPPRAESLLRIQHRVGERLGPGFAVSVSIVPEIARTQRGKHKLIDQRIAPAQEKAA